MSKLICMLLFLALCVYALFEKSPDLTSATIRFALALAFSAAFVVVVKSEFEALLD